MALFVRGLLVLSSSLALASATHYKVTDQVYLDVVKERQFLGRITIGLFGEVAPKTAQYFKLIATEGVDGKTYAGTRIHRIVKRFMIQGGDVVFNNGSGSIPFDGDNENPDTPFKVSGLIAMVTSNGCQFFITTVATPWLDGVHTVFGKVVEGNSVLHTVEHIPTTGDDRPIYDVYVNESGSVPTPDSFYVSDEPYDIWAWLRASFVPLTMSFSILAVFQWMIRRMEI